MTKKTSITLPIEVNFYEPEMAPDGKSGSIPMFMLFEGGTWSRPDIEGGKDFTYGTSGALISYLPGDRAVAVGIKGLLNAVLQYMVEQGMLQPGEEKVSG